MEMETGMETVMETDMEVEMDMEIEAETDNTQTCEWNWGTLAKYLIRRNTPYSAVSIVADMPMAQFPMALSTCRLSSL
jgi:hypothetical protein